MHCELSPTSDYKIIDAAPCHTRVLARGFLNFNAIVSNSVAKNGTVSFQNDILSIHLRMYMRSVEISGKQSFVGIDAQNVSFTACQSKLQNPIKNMLFNAMIEPRFHCNL